MGGWAGREIGRSRADGGIGRRGDWEKQKLTLSDGHDNDI